MTTGSVGILLGAALLGLVALVGLSSLAFNFFGPRYEGRKRPDSQKFVEHTRDSARLIRYRRVTRRIPTNPRCKICYIPFGGLGRVLRSKPSRLNPNFCASCFESAPLGGYETDVGILFADARGFTAWAAARTPTECAESLNRFYNSATSSLMMHDAVIDKFVGDEVMALFISDMPSMRNDMCDHMMAAAQDLLTAAQESCGELPIGIGLHCGTAWVGNVGSADVRDFTALGEVVNLAARLQACAAAGQIVLSEAVQSRLSSPPESTVAELVVKGSDQAVHARIASPLPAWD